MGAICKHGNYFGVTPTKGLNGRHCWPTTGVSKVLSPVSPPEVLERHILPLGPAILDMGRMTRFNKNTDGHRVRMFCDEPDTPFFLLNLVATLYLDGSISVSVEVTE